MTSLLRADFRRILRPSSNTHWFLVVLVAAILLNVVVMPLLVNMMSDMAGSEDVGSLGFASPLGVAGSLLWLGLLPLLCSLRIATLCWGDMRSGFNRSVVSACGKKAYFTEKLVLALVVSFAFVVIGLVITLVVALIAGGFTQGTGAVSIILWLVLTTLVCWGCSCLTLAVLWVLKSNVIAYILGISLGGGLISTIISLALGGLPDIAQAWANVVEWLPVSSVNILSSAVVDGELVLEGMGYAHVLVPTAVCIAIGFACALTILRKRDL